MPAEFLIDYNLEIKKVHYAESLNDRLGVEVLERFVETGQV